jgi:hypothetical protein
MHTYPKRKRMMKPNLDWNAEEALCTFFVGTHLGQVMLESNGMGLHPWGNVCNQHFENGYNAKSLVYFVDGIEIWGCGIPSNSLD